MADLTIQMAAEDNVSPAMHNISRSAGEMGGAVEKSAIVAGAKMAALGTLAVDAMKAASGAVANFAKSSLQAYMDQERADKQLSATLRQLGFDAAKLTDVFKAQASQFQQTLGVSDDMVQGLQTMLLRFGVAPDAIQKTTEAVLDYAAATGVDAETATWALVKALENGGQGLTRLGINIDVTGDKTTDLANAVDALGKKFGGAAAINAETLSGKIEVLDSRWGDLQESFGGFIALAEGKLGVLKLLTEAMDGLNFRLSDEYAADKERNTNTAVLTDAQEKLLALRPQLKGAEDTLADYEANGSDTTVARQRVESLRYQIKRGEMVVQMLKDERQKRIDAAANDVTVLPGAAPSAATMTFDALTITGQFAGEGTGRRGKSTRTDSGADPRLDAIVTGDREIDAAIARSREETERKAEAESDRAFKEELKAAEQHEKELLRIKEDGERQRLNALRDAAAAEQRINAQRAAAMEQAGIAAGQAFMAALGEQFRSMKQGEEFNAGDFAKAILPMAVAAGVGVATGGASLPYSGLIAGGVGAITQLFHDGGYVRDPEYHAGGNYAGEGHSFGTDTVPAMLTPGERVLSLAEIARMGGREGVEGAVEGRARTLASQSVTVIQAQDALSFQDFMGTRGGSGFVRVVNQNRGEVAQYMRRLENA